MKIQHIFVVIFAVYNLQRTPIFFRGLDIQDTCSYKNLRQGLVYSKAKQSQAFFHIKSIGK